MSSALALRGSSLRLSDARILRKEEGPRETPRKTKSSPHFAGAPARAPPAAEPRAPVGSARCRTSGRAEKLCFGGAGSGVRLRAEGLGMVGDGGRWRGLYETSVPSNYGGPKTCYSFNVGKHMFAHSAFSQLALLGPLAFRRLSAKSTSKPSEASCQGLKDLSPRDPTPSSGRGFVSLIFRVFFFFFFQFFWSV